MPHSGKTETITTYTYQCDNCGKVEGISEVVGEGAVARGMGATDPMPAGWRVMTFDREDLAFHTQRCAIGFFRRKVEESWRATDKPRRRKVAPSESLGLEVEEKANPDTFVVNDGTVSR